MPNSKEKKKSNTPSTIKTIKQKNGVYIGRAAIFTHPAIGCEVIVIAPDDTCLLHAVTKVLMEVKIDTRKNKTVRVTPEP